MPLLLTGTPGPMLGCVETLINQLAASAGQTAPALQRFDAATDDKAILDAVHDGKLCAIVVIDDPLSCLHALVEAGYTPLEAARVLTAAAAPLAAWTGRHVVRLRPEMIVGEATDAILRAMDLPAGVPPAAPKASALALYFPAAGTASMQALVDEVVAPSFAAAVGAPCAVVWSRACMLWGDHPNEKLPRIIDLTGPARVLAYGPYFHLPAGNWTVCATLAFSSETVGAPFAIELHGDVLLGRGRFKPPEAGVFTASFAAEIHSAYIPNEVRLVNETGAIDGEIGVDHIRLIPRR